MGMSHGYAQTIIIITITLPNDDGRHEHIKQHTDCVHSRACNNSTVAPAAFKRSGHLQLLVICHVYMIPVRADRDCDHILKVA